MANNTWPLRRFPAVGVKHVNRIAFIEEVVESVCCKEIGYAGARTHPYQGSHPLLFCFIAKIQCFVCGIDIIININVIYP